MSIFQDLPIIKAEERGTIYSCDKLKFIHRKKNTISADHTHTVVEILYLIFGTIEITVGEETTTLSTPTKIIIPAGVYHKVFALTDFMMLEDRESI